MRGLNWFGRFALLSLALDSTVKIIFRQIVTGGMPDKDTAATYVIIRRIFKGPRPQVDGESRLVNVCSYGS